MLNRSEKLKLPIKLKENGQPQTKLAILLMLKLPGPAPYFANALLVAVVAKILLEAFALHSQLQSL